MEDFVVVVLAALAVEAVEAVVAASVSVVSALVSGLAVSVLFNCFGSLSCLAPGNFLKKKLIL
ncbi:hypothetical protein V7122_18215 [Bacillus sp. JJ1532]